MFSLTVAAVCVGLIGIAAALAVMHHEGHLELPRWIGWRIDVDDAYDVWPADPDPAFEALVRDAMRTEAHRLDTYREETRNG